MSSKHPNSQPSLDVYHPVIGISNERTKLLAMRLRRTGLLEPHHIRGALRWGSSLKAALLMQGELQNLYRVTGLTATERDMSLLEGQIRQGLAAAVELNINSTGAIPLLPSVLYPPDKKTHRKVLAVAASEDTLVKRAITKNAVRTYFDLALDEIPSNVWLDDGFVTSAHLARARNLGQFRVVQHLNELLNADDGSLFKEGILPEEVCQGPLVSVVVQAEV